MLTKGQMIKKLKELGINKNSDYIPLHKLSFAEVAKIYGEKVGF